MLPDHMIQGVFFNWRSPKINKYGEKLKYQNWCPPKRYQFCWHLILDILVVDNGGYYVPVVATGGFSDAPGSIYRSILSSCSYCWKIFTTGASYWTTGTLCNGSRLSAFVQISALFQIYITDMSRHLHHLTKCPFEVKKGLKGLFLHWEVIANKQTLPYFVLPSGPLVKYKIL